jgi:chromosomal replication initiator protein
MDAESCWAQTLTFLEKTLTEVVFNSVIKTITPLGFENNTLTLSMDDDFFKQLTNQRYLPEITRCVRTVTNDDTDVRVVSPEDFNKNRDRRADANYSKTNLRQKYIFETFVRGKSNEFAYAAAGAVAEKLDKSGYNPLFLYGGVGLGKTHLIHAIGNRVIEKNPRLKVMYVSTETFTNEFISSIREKSTQTFKNKYRECDLLLLDDIQFLDGKEETQEEVFFTFNALYDDGKQIVLTSDQPPKELSSLEKRLTSRFAMGLTVDITRPDYETRMAILEKKLSVERLVIPQTVREFIARNFVSNIRDLEGALNKVTAYARLTNTPISLELAESALKDQLEGEKKPEISVPFIQKVVSDYYNLTVAELNGRKRTANIVFPRQIAMYLSRKILDASLPHIGSVFGGRDHTTVMHSCEKIANEMETDPRLRGIIIELEHNIRGAC